MTIAEKLYKLRSDTGLSQKEFADKIGASQSAVNYWENGNRQPRITQIKKIAKVFDIALYVLLDDNFPLPNVTSDAWKKRARFAGDTEMERVPHFTAPMSNDTKSESNETKNTQTNTIVINTDVDKNHPFNIIQRKIDNGEKLSQEEILIYNQHVKRSIETVKQAIEEFGKTLKKCYSEYYELLNEEGSKKADKIIEENARQLQKQTGEQIKLLIKVPEYQKKPDE